MPPPSHRDEILENAKSARTRRADTKVAVRRFVAGLSHERLVEIVLEVADRDQRLLDRLAQDARTKAGRGVDLAAWRGRIAAVFEVDDGYVDYDEMPSWAEAIDELIDSLADLCPQHPDAVGSLALYAFGHVEKAMGYVDNSGGELTDFSERLASLHLRACTQSAPDPVELARQLVELELHGELDGFSGAALTYAEVLGEVGLAEYRRLLAPQRALLAEPAERDWSMKRFGARVALVALAKASGDPEELIEVMRLDLRKASDFEGLAQLLVEQGRDEEALEVCRQGIAAAPRWDGASVELREVAAEILRRTGRHDEAVGLCWDAFELEPDVSTYRWLLDEVAPDLDPWRERAITLLRSRVATAERSSRGKAAAAAALIDVLLAEGDVEGAWATAKEHGCDSRRWLTLAMIREDEYPVDAIDVYEPMVFAYIDQKNNSGYRAAVDLLVSIERLALAGGVPERFRVALRRARLEHKPKRNLQALLDERGWPHTTT